jgi:hypothetical protein
LATKKIRTKKEVERLEKYLKDSGLLTDDVTKKAQKILEQEQNDTGVDLQSYVGCWTDYCFVIKQNGGGSGPGAR